MMRLMLRRILLGELPGCSSRERERERRTRMTEAVSSDAEEGPGVVVASSKDPMAAARLARSPCWLGGSGSSPNSTDHLPVASECEWRWETPYYAASTMVVCACLDRGSALWSRGAPQAFVGIFDASCEENWSDLQRALTSPEHSQGKPCSASRPSHSPFVNTNSIVSDAFGLTRLPNAQRWARWR